MPKEFINNDGQIVGEATVIARYFRQESENMTQMHQQIKVLTPEAKTELAVGAAKEMGWAEKV